ncbi:amidohydrolase family protein [bacterium]|nr:amidohydrolase family protein [bacterium]
MAAPAPAPLSPSSTPAIDVHAHFGLYPEGGSELIDRFTSGDAARVVEIARQSNIAWTIASPLTGLMPRGRADPVAGNDEAAVVVPRTPGLRCWAIVHPQLRRTFEQAETMLGQSWCAGIKIHPEEHCYPIREHGRALFEFAAGHRAIILTHSGEANSRPEEFVPWADAFPETTLILGHLGCTIDRDPSHQVRAIQASRHGNIRVDTSSASNIVPGLLEWAVGEVGAEKLLFGTDTPLYFVPMQRARIDCAGISAAAKQLILRDNAARLFGLSAR